MPITIKTERIVPTNGVQSRKILEIQALKYADLPKEYLDGRPQCYMGGGGPKSLYAADRCAIWYVEPDRIYPEEQFQQILALVRTCGSRLGEINAQARALRETWKGEETFVI